MKDPLAQGRCIHHHPYPPLNDPDCTRLGTLGGQLISIGITSDPAMKKITLVEQAELDLLPQKQIAQEIQQPELSAIVKIGTQIEDTLTNSKLTDTEKLHILERAEEKYGKLKDSMGPTRTQIVEESGTAPATIHVTPSEPPLFQAVNFRPITRRGSTSFSSLWRRTRISSRRTSRIRWLWCERLSMDQTLMN